MSGDPSSRGRSDRKRTGCATATPKEDRVRSLQMLQRESRPKDNAIKESEDDKCKMMPERSKDDGRRNFK